MFQLIILVGGFLFICHCIKMNKYNVPCKPLSKEEYRLRYPNESIDYLGEWKK